jgi:hypothetical protein
VLTDEKFRTELATYPEQALKSVGIEPTPEVVQAVQSIIFAVSQLGTDLKADAKAEAFVT